MTHKAIVYDDHARLRMDEYSVSPREIKWLLARGLRVRTRTDGGAQRWLATGVYDGRELGVVFIETAHQLILVTVLDLDR